jgi:PAS domain S-box-containing protein
MMGKRIHAIRINERLIWIGIGLAVVFWFIESAIHVFVFHDGRLIQQMVSPEKHEIWMRLIVVAILIAFGAYAQSIIGRRREAEQATKRALAELNQIFETAADGMRVVDKNFNVLRINHTLLKLSGVSEREAREKKCYEVFPGPVCHTPECPLTRILDGAERVKFDVEKERNDGVTIPCMVTATPFGGPEGELIGIVEAFRDISERKQAEVALKEHSDQLEAMVEERTRALQEAQEQLIRKEKLAVLGQLAGGVAHELRNPLSVINNAAYFLKMTLSNADGTANEYLDMVSSEVRDAEKVVSDLLNLSRIRTAIRKETEVSDLLAHVLEKRPPTKEITVSTHIAPDLPPLFVDPKQIEHVLTNLVTNAYQAMHKGGKLTMNAQSKKGQVYLSINDTGCGITRENMEKLFEPLFTTKARGIGLGLVVSRGLVEANGGSIEVASEEGKGSTFTVILPTKE